MKHESNEVVKCRIEEGDITFQEVYKKPYFPSEYEEDLKNANVLFVPYENFRDRELLVLPEDTLNFYEYFKEKARGTEVVADICISDKDYQELELHADVQNLPEILVNIVVFPVVINMISSYLYDRIKTRRSMMKINVNITVDSDGVSKRISYEGDADKFPDVMKAISEELSTK